MYCFIAPIIFFATVASCGPIVRQDAGKPIFAHYMIGSILEEHTRQDIVDAKNLGLDAFALNLDTLDGWATTTANTLFNQADELGFHLFFSFDHNRFTDPAQYTDYLKPFLARPSYFKYNNKPLVSTFGGESVSNDQWAALKTAVGDILFVPGFFRATPSTSFFDGKNSLDGIFNWNSWARADAGKIPVPDTDDTTYHSAAKSSNKLFMMGISPLQFKHIDGGQNWYVRGEDNLELRFNQVLALQPDMIELQTWNDAGEGHYMGNIWSEPIQNSPIPAYTDGFDHKGYWQVLPAFIQAWKAESTTASEMTPTNGKDFQGVLWHHTLTVDADCSSDALGKPRDIGNAEDVVSGIVLVAKGKSGLSLSVRNGSKELGQLVLVGGYNKFKFGGLGAGKVEAEIRDEGAAVASISGPLEVASSASLCNYNFQVVGFPS